MVLLHFDKYNRFAPNVTVLIFLLLFYIGFMLDILCNFRTLTNKYE